MTSTTNNKHFDTKGLIKSIRDYLPDFNEKLFKEAFEFAEKAHEGQFRKDNKTPYVVHPLRTVELLTELHVPEEILLAALLHDVPEDTKYDIHEVKDRFGDRVAFLVDGITKLSKVHYQRDMPARQVESLKKLFLHSAKDPGVIIIKLADRLHNMQTLQHVEPEKRLRIARETLEIFVPIANLLGIQSLKCKLEDFCFKYLFANEYEELAEALSIINKGNRSKLKKFAGALNDAFENYWRHGEIS